jgi:hypothetical protein
VLIAFAQRIARAGPSKLAKKPFARRVDCARDVIGEVLRLLHLEDLLVAPVEDQSRRLEPG